MRGLILIILITILLVTVVGCGKVSRFEATYTGYSVICVKETGVKYVQFISGAAPLLTQEGKPAKCD